MKPRITEFGFFEKAALLGAIFFFSFGLGLVVDGKKLLQQQRAASVKVDYKNTLNPI
jgi:hypothetical protein